MRFMSTPATFVALCVFARVTTCRGLHQRRFRALRYDSLLLRTYRVLSYGTHDPFPLTITPLLSSRLAHTSSVNPPLDRPQRWERYTYSLLSVPNNEYKEVLAHRIVIRIKKFNAPDVCTQTPVSNFLSSKLLIRNHQTS